MSTSLSTATRPSLGTATHPTSGRVEAVVLQLPTALNEPPPEDTLARYVGASLAGFLTCAFGVLAYLTIAL